MDGHNGLLPGLHLRLHACQPAIGSWLEQTCPARVATPVCVRVVDRSAWASWAPSCDAAWLPCPTLSFEAEGHVTVAKGKPQRNRGRECRRVQYVQTVGVQEL